MNYAGKNVIITGAAYGIGKAFAEYFSAKGARLILVDIEKTLLKEVASALPKSSEEHLCLIKDLSKIEERQAIFDELQAKGIDVHVLVNNVGIGYCSHLVDTPWERIEKVIEVNAKGTTHLVWLFLPQMLKRKSGIILNISSTGAFCGANNSCAYTGSKAYVTNFTEGLDMELFGTGVRVLTAHPGATDTHFWEDAGTNKMSFFKKVKMMSPQDTVAEFMSALDGGKKVIIAGWRNRVMVSLAKFVPRELLKKMAVNKYK